MTGKHSALSDVYFNEIKFVSSKCSRSSSSLYLKSFIESMYNLLSVVEKMTLFSSRNRDFGIELSISSFLVFTNWYFEP